MTLCKTIALRWKSHLHCHWVIILSQNKTSMHEEHFACGRFPYKHGFVNGKLVQGGPSHKDRGALGTGLPTRQYYSSNFT